MIHDHKLAWYCAIIFLDWSILEARAEILTKKIHFLGVLKTPKFPSEIEWPLYLEQLILSTIFKHDCAKKKIIRENPKFPYLDDKEKKVFLITTIDVCMPTYKKMNKKMPVRHVCNFDSLTIVKKKRRFWSAHAWKVKII